MAENEILKAVRHCATEELCAGCPFSDLFGSECAEEFARYIIADILAEKRNEPAPAPTETSSEVSSSDTHKLMHLDDSTLLDICQEKLEEISKIALGDYPNEFLTGYIVAVKDIIKGLRGGNPCDC